MNGDEYLYLTLHKIDEGVDSGDILYESRIKITEDDDANTLYGKCENESASAIIKCIYEIKSGKAGFRNQETVENTKTNKKLTDEEIRINWNDSSIKIRNKIRALIPPYPGAYSTHNNIKFLFTKSKAIEISDVNEYVNGEIIDFEFDTMNIKCGKGILKVQEIADSEQNSVHLKNTFRDKGIFI
jgi:methionyl-tRNA formyltransferase